MENKECFGEKGRKKRAEGMRKEEEEEQEGSKLCERNVLEMAEVPFWDLSLRNCLRGEEDGRAAVLRCDDERMFSLL